MVEYVSDTISRYFPAVTISCPKSILIFKKNKKNRKAFEFGIIFFIKIILVKKEPKIKRFTSS
jgi:hypothetical protein